MLTGPTQKFPIDCRCGRPPAWYSSLPHVTDTGVTVTAYVCHHCGRWQVWRCLGEEGDPNFKLVLSDVGHGPHQRPPMVFKFPEKIPWKLIAARALRTFQDT